jgi:hypothetical protein
MLSLTRLYSHWYHWRVTSPTFLLMFPPRLTVIVYRLVLVGKMIVRVAPGL